MKREVADARFGFSVENVRFNETGRQVTLYGIISGLLEELRSKKSVCADMAKGLPGVQNMQFGFLFDGGWKHPAMCTKHNGLSCEKHNNQKGVKIPNVFMLGKNQSGGKMYGSKAKNQNQA